MIWSEHALERAKERFPDISIERLEAMAKYSRLATKKTKSKLKALCPESAKTWMVGGYQGRYFKCTKEGIVFVIHAPETIVTLFRIE